MKTQLSYVDKIYYNRRSDPNTIVIIFGGPKARGPFKLYSDINVLELFRWFFNIYKNEGWDEITQKIEQHPLFEKEVA